MVPTKLCILLLIVNSIASISSDKHLLIDELRLDFLGLEENLWKFVLWEAPTINREEAEFYLVKYFSAFDKKLKQMPEDILRGLEPIRDIKAFLFLYSELKNTENLYEKFIKFQEDQLKINNIAYNDKKTISGAIEFEDIIRDILHPKTGANATVHKVNDLIFGEQNSAMDILDVLVKDFQCKNVFQSPEQVFYNLYNVIALNGLKDYVMLQFAYLARRINEKGNYTDLSTIAQVNFDRRVNETMSVFRGAMQISSKTIWRCDPKYHIRDETYTEMTRLLQGHIQNEVDLNAGGTCRDNCAYYPLSTSHGCYDNESKYCRDMERCTGKIIGCRFIESHMDICVSKNPSRRYEYIEFASGRTMGKKNRCWKKPVQSWWRWFVHCSYCMCLCDEQGPKSDRYINMRPVMANTKNDRVITGLRFLKHNRIIHLQIQEGKLLPYGYIDNSTVRWVPVDNYEITDPGVYSGEDYFTMTYENRSLALDLVEIIDHNSVMTGVGFVFHNKMLRLQIEFRPFDWKTGKVSEIIRTTYKSSGGKDEIDLSNVDVPTETPSGEINYNPNSYVKFTHTSFEKDAAQTTIPFFDTQPVYSHPPVPLRGAGIYFRGRDGYGGFITPTIETYSYYHMLLYRHQQSNQPSIEPRDGELETTVPSV